MSNVNAYSMKAFAAALLSVLLLVLAPGLAAQDDVVMKAMRDEMARSKADLRLPDMDKPYYIEYRVDESNFTTLSATLGVLTDNNTTRSRTLTIQVRVGDYKLDNTNFLAVDSFGPRMMFPTTRTLPLDDDYSQIRREIWLATDRAYKQAASTLAAKRSVLQTRKYTDSLPDFIAQKPITVHEAQLSAGFDKEQAEKMARDISAVFRNAPQIIDSDVKLTVRDSSLRYLNSEDTTVTRSQPVVALQVRAHARGDDGMPMEDSFSEYSRDLHSLNASELIVRARAMADKLLKLRDGAAPERYNGPVLFEGEAAGAIFAEVFAPAISAARFPITDQPQFEAAVQQMFGQMGGTSLAEKLGGRVMPDFLDVVDRPRLDSFDGKPLLGVRSVDDEGVPTQELQIVEGGILKNLLATRTPTAETKASTGSKGILGAVPSNLFLTAKKTQNTKDLRETLLKLAKARGYDYGIVVRHAGEGRLSWFNRFAGSMGAQAGTIVTGTIDMYKVFADGREELVRGAELGSLTANSFKDVVAVGDKPIVYNGPHIPLLTSVFSGFGGNMSGDALAVGSFVAPSILFEEVSLKKANIPAPNAPVVPSPLPALTQH